MTEVEEVDTAVELVQIILHDGEVWIADPDLLHPDSLYEDVLAVQYVAGQLWILDGVSRTWVDVAGKAKLKPVR